MERSCDRILRRERGTGPRSVVDRDPVVRTAVAEKFVRTDLDAKLRLEMRGEIRRICKETGFTTIYVTHDQKEALSVARKKPAKSSSKKKSADSKAADTEAAETKDSE